jgi:[ribosomal protein S18]-alanine N-acetyltransferase
LADLIIRRGGAPDLSGVAAIQAGSPEAAQWSVADYLGRDFRVAVSGSRVAGFLVCRALTQGEFEVLNLAVGVEFRLHGVGRRLVESLLAESPAEVYLEVRESNLAARKFYQIMGFQEVGVRREYYRTPPESAIVMKFHSC